jgi:hypothetical protein
MAQFKRGVVAAACLGLFVSGAALSTIDSVSPVGPAFAKNGDGNGGGKGGDGGGKGNSGGNHGKSSDRGNSANAHDKSKIEKASLNADDDDQNTLGPLNAAHASARARERAAPNSSVGKIAAYERSREDALALDDPTLREQALDDAVAQLETAFGRPLTDAQVDRVNALLDARQ